MEAATDIRITADLMDTVDKIDKAGTADQTDKENKPDSTDMADRAEPHCGSDENMMAVDESILDEISGNEQPTAGENDTENPKGSPERKREPTAEKITKSSYSDDSRSSYSGAKLSDSEKGYRCYETCRGSYPAPATERERSSYSDGSSLEGGSGARRSYASPMRGGATSQIRNRYLQGNIHSHE